MNQNTHIHVLSFLAILRGAHPDMAYIYTHGSCYRLFLLLRNAFEAVVPYHSLDHVVSLIEGRFYDITGEVHGDYRPMDDAAHARHRHCRAGGEIHHPHTTLSDPGNLTATEQARHCGGAA